MVEQDLHAFIFPGQGSQKSAMGKFLLKHPDTQISRVAGIMYDEGSDILEQDLKTLCLDSPQEILDQTINAQPAIVITSLTALKVLQDHGVSFNATAGHSVGELPALFAAGVLTFGQTLLLTKLRAELMTKAGEENPGKMAAVLNIPYEEIELFCKDNNLYLANDNSDTQVVISGLSDGIDRLAAEYPFDRKKLTGSIVLPVSIASHCVLMESASKGLAERLKTQKVQEPNPHIVFVANRTGKREENGETIRNMIPEQLKIQCIGDKALITCTKKE